MPFRNFPLLETCKGGGIPLFISAIFHTSLILTCALCYSVDEKPNESPLAATFGSEQPDPLELDIVEISNTEFIAGAGLDRDTGLILYAGPGEFTVTDSHDIQENTHAIEQLALKNSQLKAVASPTKTPKTIAVSKSSNHQLGRKNIVTHVSSSSKLLSFGKRNDFGARQFVLGQCSTLDVSIPGLDPLGSRVLSQAGNLSLTGGAMMVSTACPAPALSGTPLQFNYDVSKEDGRRLVVVAGTQAGTFPIFDWELKPLAKFVDSGHNGAVSIQMLGNRENVSLDAAFEQTLLGLRFIQADLMPRGIIMSQDFLPQSENGIIFGPGEEERLSSDEDVKSAVRELKPLMERTRNGASYSVLTDASIRFVFEIDGDNLAIAGTPYFFFWEPAKKANVVIPNKVLNEAIKNAWPQLKRANPLVVESMERSFRAVAFFRFQKQNSPAKWSSFVREVSSITLGPVATPAVLTN